MSFCLGHPNALSGRAAGGLRTWTGRGARCGRRRRGDRDQFDREDQRGARRYGGRRTLVTIAELGRDDELPAAANLHSRHTLVPSGDQREAVALLLGAGAEDGTDWLSAWVAAGIELVAVTGQPACVIRHDSRARGNRGPVTNLEVDDLQPVRELDRRLARALVEVVRSGGGGRSRLIRRGDRPGVWVGVWIAAGGHDDRREGGGRGEVGSSKVHRI